MRRVDSDALTMHIERVGVPTEWGDKASSEELLPVIAAIVGLCREDAVKAVSAEPTAEEMLALGITIGIQEVAGKQRVPRRSSPWRLAARLGI